MLFDVKLTLALAGVSLTTLDAFIAAGSAAIPGVDLSSVDLNIVAETAATPAAPGSVAAPG